MALDADKLSGLIQGQMKAAGFNVEHELCRIKPMADAIAQAVVQHIKNDAEGIPTGAGFKVQ